MELLLSKFSMEYFYINNIIEIPWLARISFGALVIEFLRNLEIFSIFRKMGMA